MVRCSAVAILKFLTFEHGAPCVHFALGFAHDIVCPDYRSPKVLGGSVLSSPTPTLSLHQLALCYAPHKGHKLGCIKQQPFSSAHGFGGSGMWKGLSRGPFFAPRNLGVTATAGGFSSHVRCLCWCHWRAGSAACSPEPLHVAPPRGMGISGMGVLSGSTSEEASGEPASQEGQAKAAWPFLTQPQSHTASFLVNSVGYSESVRQVQIQEKGL